MYVDRVIPKTCLTYGNTPYNNSRDIFRLNTEQPVPSLLLDQIVSRVENKEIFETLGYFFARFHRSAFGYKLRPWTKLIFIKKGIDFGSFEELVTVRVRKKYTFL